MKMARKYWPLLVGAIALAGGGLYYSKRRAEAEAEANARRSQAQVEEEIERLGLVTGAEAEALKAERDKKRAGLVDTLVKAVAAVAAVFI